MVETPRVIRWAPAILLIGAMLTAGAAWTATWIEPEVDFVDTVPAHDGLEPYRRILEELDGVRFVALYMGHDEASGTSSLRGDAFDALVAEQGELTQHLQGRFGDDMTHTLSAWEGMRGGHYMFWKLATAGNPPADTYSVPTNPIIYDQVKSQVLGDDTLDDVLARDGSSALLLVFLPDRPDARQLAADIGQAAVEWADERATVTTDHEPSGLLWSSHVTDERNRDEMIRLAPWAAGATIVGLLVAVRRPAHVVIAVTTTAIALVWTYGLMGLFGVRISFLTFILAPLVIGIGIDHSVHWLQRYEEARRSGEPARRAATIAVRGVGPAVRLAAITTAAGLAMLLLVPAPLFAQIGGVAAVGILLSWIAAATLTPAMRTLLPDHGGRKARPERIGAALARWGGKRRAWAAVLVLLAVGLSALAYPALRIESGSAENEFPQDDPVIRLQQRIEQEYGAFQRAYLVYEGDIAEPDALRSLLAAQDAAAELPLFRSASSVVDLILADEATDQGAVDIGLAALLGATGQTPSEEDRLPATRAEGAGAIEALFDDPLWRTITPFTISRDAQLAVLAIEIDPWADQEEMMQLRDALVELAQRIDAELPAHRVHAAGAPVNRAAIVDQTPIDVGIAILGTTGAVALVLAVAWIRKPRDVRHWALAVAVMLASGLLLLAAVAGLDAVYRAADSNNSAALTNMFLIAFAITTAAGVDDTVHLVHRRRNEAPTAAWRGAGRAITGTTLTTGLAFTAMASVYFLQSKNLAILAATGVLVAYLATLGLGPWLLRARSNEQRSA